MGSRPTRSGRFLHVALLVTTPAVLGAANGSDPPAAAEPVSLGARVRLFAPGVASQVVQGVVVESNPESVVVGTEGQGRLTVPWRAITRLEVSSGERSNATKGFLIGVGAGAALSVVLPKCDNEGCSSDAGFDATFAIAYGLIGGAIGKIIGSQVKSEKWRPVPVGVAVAPTRGRGIRVVVSINLR